MANVSPNNITNLTQDWGSDPSAGGAPFSGSAVQQFIKSYLGAIAKASFFDSQTMTLYYFKSEEDKQTFIDNPQRTDVVLFSTNISFQSDLFRIALDNQNGSTILNIATNEEELQLVIGFEVQKKAITDTIWQGQNVGVIATAQVDVGATGEYVQIHEPKIYNAGETYTLDVFPYLATGANRVRVQFVDEDDDSVTTSITYTINVTEMFIESMNNTWYTPIVEGGDASAYKLGGYRIVGALNKTLHLDIYSSDTKVLEFTYPIGTTSFDRVPFNYIPNMGLDLSTLSTGVYLVSAYLTSGSGDSMITSAAVNNNIMYIEESDAYTAQLICINEVADSIYNYTTSRMFDYSIYNRGSMTGSPHIEILQITGTTPETVIDGTLNDIPTATQQSYEVDIEWITQETINLKVRANMDFGNRQTVDVPLDNTTTFPPVPGYDFYLNCATRSNADSNYLKLVNVKDKSEYTPVWTEMTWVDGVDGWISDDIDRKCLYIRAGSQMSLPYTELQLISGDGITLEFCYRVSNVSDYSETVIDIIQEAGDTFKGIKIKPTNILVHSSSDSTDAQDMYRGTNLMDEEVVHFALTIYPNFNGTTGKNLVTGYINGCKNFQFEYASGAIWSTEGAFRIGANRSDVSLYFVRRYASVLSDVNIQENYINSLRDIYARRDLAEVLSSVMNAAGTAISYESVRDNDKNFFVVEMLGTNSSVPSRAAGWSSDDKGRCNLEMHYGEHPEWDWKIFNTEIGGQGTTSMNYYRWNLRWRIDKTDDSKKVPVAYLSSRSKHANKYEYTWTDSSSSKTVVFDGAGNHPPVKRICAKINSASSMQSHKMGATWMYNELRNAIGIRNEAQQYAIDNNQPVPTTAVYQYPAYGFAKVGSEYQFIGIFTIGPDKGDKPTFGFDIVDETAGVDIPSELISLEGTDHARKLVMFNQPWNSDVKYLASNECLNIELGTNSYDKGWEVGNCFDLDVDKAYDQENVQTVLEAEFKPGYELAFYNSTLLHPIALNEYGATASATIAVINNNISTFTSTVPEGYRFGLEFYQIWVEGDYDVYYYDLKSNSYVATGRNLVTEHGTPSGSTLVEQNNWFKAKRCERFMAFAENYWDIHDACYHMVIMILLGAMDNFGKNSYPVKMKTLANGGRWGWRQDDLDSLGGIGNLGADTMPRWMEFLDSNNGTPYFGGSQSVFWNLIYECYYDDYLSTVSGSYAPGLISTGKSVLNAMSSLASVGGGMLAGLMGYIKTRFWDKAQNYFPQSAYNADATFKYETAWLDPEYSGVSLIQSLGNHYSAEYYWFYQRMIYMMSFFRVGPFGVYDDTSLGKINFRPLNWQNPTFTPYTTLYPALANGTNILPTSRTLEGQSHEFTGSFGNGETDINIIASNTLSYLGDWKDVKLSPGYLQTISIQAAKLVRFKIGDETQTVTTTIPGISFSNTKCLEEIDARNAESLSGVLDLTTCPRLRRAWLDGTSITQVNFANGQPIEYLSLPESVTNISMKNMRALTSANFQMPSDLSKITLFQMENCGVDSLELLYDIYNTNDNQLRYISVTVNDIKSIDNNDLTILGGLASDKDKDGNYANYAGVNSDGTPSSTTSPNIIGIVRMDTPFYMDTFNELGMDPDSEMDYGTDGWKINRIGNLGGLDLIYDPTSVYIRFADSEVLSVLLANGIGDGTGITVTQAAAVTSISGWFQNNTTIESFDELKYFTGVTILYQNYFSGCSSLETLTLPLNNIQIRAGAFTGCTSLYKISNFENLTSNNQTFRGLPISEIHASSLQAYLTNSYGGPSGNPFAESTAATRGLYINNVLQTEIDIPDGVTSIGNYMFIGNNTIASLTIPSSVTSIGVSAFQGCSGLTGTLTIPSSVTFIGTSAFYGCSGLTNIYVAGSINGNSPQFETGDNNGTFFIAGNWEGNIANNSIYAKYFYVGGNLSSTAGYEISNRPIEAFEVAGDATFTNTSISILYDRSNSKKLKFFAIDGELDSVKKFFYNNNQLSNEGCIIHLGASGIACTPAIACASYAGVSHIYVGDGSSAAHDDAILAQYLADTDWSAYSAKLDTWYNYVQSGGEYATPPTIPTE